jgi:hypothetical protein
MQIPGPSGRAESYEFELKNVISAEALVQLKQKKFKFLSGHLPRAI